MGSIDLVPNVRSAARFSGPRGLLPSAFNSGQPAVHSGACADTVTLVEGATFCLSDRQGDIVLGRPHGFFFRDARVLSRWELRVDGQLPEPLSVDCSEAFAARFIQRRAPRVDRADSTLLVVRERLVAEWLRETITVENLNHEATVVSVEVHVDADFADLFAVKEGRVSLGGADMDVANNELVLHERSERLRGVTVTASGEPIVLPGSLTWRVVVPPGQHWQTQIIVEPTWANQKVTARFDHSGQVQFNGPAHKLEAWRDTATNVETDNALLAAVLRQTEGDLGALLIRDESRCWRAPNWQRSSTTPPVLCACANVRRHCVPGSSRASGCRSRGGTRSPWTTASNRSTP